MAGSWFGFWFVLRAFDPVLHLLFSSCFCFRGCQILLFSISWLYNDRYYYIVIGSKTTFLGFIFESSLFISEENLQSVRIPMNFNNIKKRKKQQKGTTKKQTKIKQKMYNRTQDFLILILVSC